MSRMLQALKQLSTKETAAPCAASELMSPAAVAVAERPSMPQIAHAADGDDDGQERHRAIDRESRHDDTWTRPWALALGSLEDLDARVSAELDGEAAADVALSTASVQQEEPTAIDAAWQAAMRRNEAARRAAEVEEAARVEAELQRERQREAERQAALRELEAQRLAERRAREARDEAERASHRLAVVRSESERQAIEEVELKRRELARLEAARLEAARADANLAERAAQDAAERAARARAASEAAAELAREQELLEEQQLEALHRESERLEQIRDEARQLHVPAGSRSAADVLPFTGQSLPRDAASPAWQGPAIVTVGDCEARSIDSAACFTPGRELAADYLRLAGEMLARSLGSGARAVAVVAADAASAAALDTAELARAMAIAERGDTLLVPYRAGGIDVARLLGADLARAAERHAGGIPSDWIVPTAQPRLSLLPPSGRLAGDGPLADVLLLPRCKRRFSLVLVDAGAWDEAALPLLQQADAVFVLLTLAHTRQAVAADVAARLRRAGVHTAGCICASAKAVRREG